MHVDQGGFSGDLVTVHLVSVGLNAVICSWFAVHNC